MKIDRILIIILISIITCLIVAYLLFQISNFGHSGMGQFGDLYGGIVGTIVSAITLWYLVYTVEEMKKQNKLIINQNEHNSFIMLLHNYHEIINDLDTTKINEFKQAITLTGREAIKYILETNTSEIENLKHIVESAIIVLKFPEKSEINNRELKEKRKTNQNHFNATLSVYEKKAILKIKDNYQGNEIDKEFVNFMNKINES
jgi:hypothetical protein